MNNSFDADEYYISIIKSWLEYKDKYINENDLKTYLEYLESKKDHIIFQKIVEKIFRNNILQNKYSDNNRQVFIHKIKGIISKYQKKFHDQKISNENLCVVLATYEIIYNKITGSNQKGIFNYYVVHDFNKKTLEELYQQAYIQLWSFNTSYSLFKLEYHKYEYHENFPESIIFEKLKSWIKVENESLNLLIDLLMKILKDLQLDLKEYRSYFVTNLRKNGKAELTYYMPIILSNVGNSSQDLNIGKSKEENACYQQLEISKESYQEEIRRIEQFIEKIKSLGKIFKY
jgi:hypothetical protein